jgi:hypothetical protein
MITALLLATAVAQDSADLHRVAVDAQAAFERTRRAQLPLAAWIRGGGSRCEERIGRFCYWYNADDPPPPPEPASITTARDALIARLDSLAALLPGDGWIAGQRVRYLLDARRADEAVEVAANCHAEPTMCRGLLGLALHAAGEAAAADRAFTAMLAGMDATKRCEWADLRLLLPSDEARRFRRLSCAERIEEAERLLALADPLLGVEGNAFRGEFHARQVMAELFEGTMSPHGTRFGGDQREMMLRYGWPVAWSRTWSPDIMRDGSVVGHDPSPAWAFLAVDSREPRWNLARERARARARPPSIAHIREFDEVQLARFPRRDQTLVVARWHAPDDSIFNGGPVRVVLAAGADGRVGRVEQRAESGQSGQTELLVKGMPALAGLEVGTEDGSSWARYRQGWADAHAPDGTRLSDPLLFDAAGGEPQSLELALPVALPGTSVPRGGTVGVYWEAAVTAADSVTMRLLVRRDQSPRPRLSVSWRDAPGTDGMIRRGIALDLSRLGRGAHWLELELEMRDGGPPVRAVRRFVIE